MVLLFLLALLFPLAAFAQAASLPVDIPADVALAQLVQSLGGLKGASVLAIAVLVVQSVLLFFRTKLASFAGKWRLLIVAGLNLIVVFLALLAAGIPLLSAFTHANTALAFQVLVHQVIKQVSEKPEA
jgi:hypothetical protein